MTAVSLPPTYEARLKKLEEEINHARNGTIGGGVYGVVGSLQFTPGGIPILPGGTIVGLGGLKTGIPKTPTGLILTPGAGGGDVWVDASWAGTVGGEVISSWGILVIEDGDPLPRFDNPPASAAPPYRISGLKPNTLYHITVWGVTSLGAASGNLGPQDVTTIADDTPPAQVTGLTVLTGYKSIIGMWTALGGSPPHDWKGTYEAQVSTSSTFPNTSATTTVNTGQANVVNFNGLITGTNYYVRVRAISPSLITGPYSTTSGPHTPGKAEPLPSDGIVPTGTVTKPKVTGAIGFIYTQWNKITNSDAVTYEVHLSTDPTFTPSNSTKVVEVLEASGTAIKTLPGVTTSLSYATDYYIKIYAKDADGYTTAGPSVVSDAVQILQVNGLDLVDSAVTAQKIAATPANANLIFDSSFEAAGATSADLSRYWTLTTVGSGTWTRDTTHTPAHGTAQAKWTTTSTTANQWASAGSTVFTVVAGDKLSARYQWRLSTNVVASHAKIFFYDSSNSILSTWFLASSNGPIANNTTHDEVIYQGSSSFTVPAGAVTAQFFLMGGWSSNGSTCTSYWDQIYISSGDLIGAWAPNPAEILPGTVFGDMIVARTITAGNIATNEITANEMKTGTITAASGIIHDLSADIINTGTLDASVVDVTNLDAASISTGAIAADIAYLGTVGAGQITAGSLSSSVILTSNLSASQINAGTMLADRIGSGTISASFISIASGGLIQSSNYNSTAGSEAGWRIDSAGNAYLNNAFFRGTIFAATLGSNDFYFVNSSPNGIGLRIHYDGFRSWMQPGASTISLAGIYWDHSTNKMYFAGGGSPVGFPDGFAADPDNEDTLLTVRSTVNAKKDNGGDFGHMSLRATDTTSHHPGIGFHDEASSTAAMFAWLGDVAQYFEARNSGNTGWVDIHANAFVVPPSNLSMKTNVSDISNSLENLKKLRHIEYNLKQEHNCEVDKNGLPIPPKKGPSSRKYFGFVAEELKEVFPHCVVPTAEKDEDGNTLMAVDYMRMIVPVSNAVLELEQKIVALEKKVGKDNGRK